MLKRIGMLVFLLAFVIALPTISQSAPHPHKYGIEFQVGGNYSLMSEVNDYIHASLVNYGPTIDKTNIGAQFGLGITYRQLDNFGWNIGYNRIIEINKYRAAAFITATESWSEQTVQGSEFYALATWYKPFGNAEMSFGVGPAVYSAELDRINDLVLDANGPHLVSGFTGASGKAMGLMATVGFELPIREKLGLLILGGGRLANVGEILWEDPNNTLLTTDQVVYFNKALGDKQDVDFTGGFVKIALRAYFEPSSKWRSAKK